MSQILPQHRTPWTIAFPDPTGILARWPAAALGKRGFDVAMALCGLVLLAPLILLSMLLVLVDSGRPIFYRARRPGLNGRTISVLKLRTMRLDADRTGRGISSTGDARVTRVGRVLRRWKLDELPQLWNVLVGDMSVVGPRPQSPDVAEAPEAEPLIYAVRPGLTDWGSILFNDEGALLASADDVGRYYETRVRPLKRLLAREYARRANPLIDALIVVQTAWVLFASRVLRHRAELRPWRAEFARTQIDTLLGATRPGRAA